MTESEKVNKWFDSELSMRPEESLDSVECEEVKEICLNAIKEREQYRAIGTVSEFAELKGKATPKKPIYSDFDENEDEEIIPYKAVCPVCGYEFEFGTWNDEENHHCECGQKMLWD